MSSMIALPPLFSGCFVDGVVFDKSGGCFANFVLDF